MKKLLPIIVTVATLFTSIVTVDAKSVEVDLRDIETNTFIIGERIYELNNYYLSIYDIVSASTEYTNEHNGDRAPIFYYAGSSYDNARLIEYTGGMDASGRPTTTNRVLNEVYPDGKMMATYKNNIPLYEYIREEVEPKVVSAVNTLNNTVTNNPNYGLESVTYNNETKTVTFEVSDLTKKLIDFKDSGIVELFAVIAENATDAKYTVNGTDVTVSLNKDTDIVEAAAKLLGALAGTDDYFNINYGQVNGKSVTALMTYMFDGNEYTESFTVEFTFDAEKQNTKFEEAKDAEISSVINGLNKGTGFENITYNTENNTVTFEIKDASVLLTAYANEIATAFGSFMGSEAVKAEYTVNGQTIVVDLNNMDNDALISEAAKLLTLLTGKDLSEAGTLVLKDVANKDVSANITFVVNGVETTIKYNVSFVLDEEAITEKFETEKDEVINNSVNTLKPGEGFNTITYNKETNTVVFDIKNANVKLIDYANEIVAVFSNFAGNEVKNAKYIINGKEVNVDLSNMDGDALIREAAKLLGALAGREFTDPIEMADLTLGEVANKSVTASLVFEVKGIEMNINYTVDFKLDVEAITEKFETEKDEVIESSVNSLDPKEGFESITYNKENNTVTFTSKNDDARLVDYANEIVAVFSNFAGNEVKSAKYIVNDEEVNVDLSNMDGDALIREAAKLLGALAGREFTDPTEMVDLTIGEVKGSSVTANLTFEVNGVAMEIDYTVVFN